jgi:hypothetical protein
MAIIRCPVCRTKFKWDITQGYPEFCINTECESRIAHDRADDDIVLPSMRSSKLAVADRVYREMEAGSEVRAQAAASMMGVPTAEMSELKITNLRDNQRQGDLAVAQRNLPGVAYDPSAGSQYASSVRSGPFPNRGMQVLDNVRAMHEQSGGMVSRPA